MKIKLPEETIRLMYNSLEFNILTLRGSEWFDTDKYLKAIDELESEFRSDNYQKNGIVDLSETLIDTIYESFRLEVSRSLGQTTYYCNSKRSKKVKADIQLGIKKAREEELIKQGYFRDPLNENVFHRIKTEYSENEYVLEKDMVFRFEVKKELEKVWKILFKH